MASSTSTEENVKFPVVSKQEIYDNWQKNATKIMFGEHQLCIEINDLDEFFVQKAKEELRETPEVIAQGFKELRELLAGNKNLIVKIRLSLCVISVKCRLRNEE